MMSTPWSIAVSENLVAAISFNNLILLDITDVTFPRILNQLALPEGLTPQERARISLRDVVIAGNYAYVTWVRYSYTVGSEGGVQVLDISDPTAPTVVGNLKADGAILGLALLDSTLYIGLGDDLVVVDVSNPAEPSVLGSVTLAGQFATVEKINVHADDDGQIYAFVVSTNGNLYVLDVTDAGSPTQIANFEATYSCVQDIALVDDGETLHAYLADCYAGLLVLDVTEPTSPIEISSYSLDGSVYRIAATEHWVLVATDDDSSSWNTTVHVFDISAPGTLVLGSAYQQVEYAWDMLIVDDLLVVADNARGVRFVNLAGTLAPIEIGRQDIVKAHADIAIDGHYLFMVDDDGLKVIDIFNPVLPGYVAEFGTPHAASITLDAGYALVTDYRSGLWVLDVSDPLAPTLVGYVGTEMSTTSDVAILGGFGSTVRIPMVFIAGKGCNPFTCRASLKVVNLSDPTDPQVTSIFDDGRGVSNMDLAGDHIYATTGFFDALTNDLVILDVSNPTQPITTSTTALSDRCRDIVVIDQYAYVALENEILIFDVSNPNAPTLDSSFTELDELKSMVVSNDLLYVANGYARLSLLDISDPSNPEIILTQALSVENLNSGTINSLSVQDGFVYIVNEGLSIWRHRDDVLGRALDAWGQPFSGVTIQADAQAIAASGVSGGYAPADELFGSRTLSAHIGSFSAWPLTQTVNLDEAARAQNFYVLARPISALVQPGVSTTLGYVDTQGLPTDILFPPGAVSQERAVRLTPTMASHRAAQYFVGNAFELAATDGMGEDAFGAPVQVSIKYSDLGIRVVDEASLTLMAENNGTWVEATSLCQEPLEHTRDLDNNTLGAFICTWGRFALYGETNQLYLPLIIN
jgi:hypothetical protein